MWKGEALSDDEGSTQLCVRFMDAEGLKSNLLRLGSISDNGILQQFIDPKPAVDATKHNNIIQTYWQPNHIRVERRQNRHSLTDKRFDYQTKAETFEGTFQNAYQYPLMSTIILDEIKTLNDKIAEHLWFVADCIVKRMVLNWKMDAQNRIWFLWCSSVSVMERDTVFRQPVELLQTVGPKKKEKEEANKERMSNALNSVKMLRKKQKENDSFSKYRTTYDDHLDHIGTVTNMSMNYLGQMQEPSAADTVYDSYRAAAEKKRIRRYVANSRVKAPGNSVGDESKEVITDLMWGGRSTALKRIVFDTQDLR
jgi:hypothetical protein